MANNYKVTMTRTLDAANGKYVNALDQILVNTIDTDYNMQYMMTLWPGSFLGLIWVEYTDTAIDQYKNNQVHMVALTSSQYDIDACINFFNITLYYKTSTKFTATVPIPGVPNMATSLDERWIPITANNNGPDDWYYATDRYGFTGYKNQIVAPDPASYTTVQYRLGSPTTPNIANKPFFKLELSEVANFSYSTFPWFANTATYERTNISWARIGIKQPAI